MTVDILMDNLSMLDTSVVEGVLSSAYSLCYEAPNKGENSDMKDVRSQLMSIEVSQNLINFLLIRLSHDYQFDALKEQLNKLKFNTYICDYIEGKQSIVGNTKTGIANLKSVLNSISSIGVGLSINNNNDYYLTCIPFEANWYRLVGKRKEVKGYSFQDMDLSLDLLISKERFESYPGIKNGRVGIKECLNSDEIMDSVDRLLINKSLILHVDKNTKEFCFYRSY